jgi:hypothetical protein
MAEQGSRAQRDKEAAEVTTAAVGAEQRQEKAEQSRTATAAEKRQQNQAGDDTATDDERRTQIREDLAKADSAADKLQKATDADADLAGEVALNPYPEYEANGVDQLRSTAEGRKVEINRDVEKAELVSRIRAKDPTNASLDFMTLEQLRGLAGEKDVALSEEFETAHLVTELRAADTGVNNPGQHVL